MNCEKTQFFLNTLYYICISFIIPPLLKPNSLLRCSIFIMTNRGLQKRNTYAMYPNKHKMVHTLSTPMSDRRSSSYTGRTDKLILGMSIRAPTKITQPYNPQIFPGLKIAQPLPPCLRANILYGHAMLKEPMWFGRRRDATRRLAGLSLTPSSPRAPIIPPLTLSLRAYKARLQMQFSLSYPAPFIQLTYHPALITLSEEKFT